MKMELKNNLTSNSRRQFLKTTGSLTLGFCLWDGCTADQAEEQSAGELPGSLRRHSKVNAWIEILDDGRIRVLTGKLELGQGIRIAVAQVAAEELNADIDMVEVNLAETGRTPNEGYTAGSRSIESSAMAIRYAAAVAKEKLLNMAAAKMAIDKNRLSLEKDTILDAKSKTQLKLTELLQGRQIEDEIELPFVLKNKSDYKYVGRPIPRKDIEKMARGEQVHIHDLRFPGMVHGRIVRPPNYRSTLAKVDLGSVQSMEGVLKVVNNGSFLGIIAEDEYQAILAAQTLQEQSSWDQLAMFPADFDADAILKLPSEPHNVKTSGEPLEPNATEGVIAAQYSKPYIMHGSVGPSCAVALFAEGQLTIWSHTQGVYPLKAAIGGMLGLEEDQLQIIGVPGSGCYGHNGADDVAAEAALLAMDFPGRHVRLQWHREDEHSWEPYGTAMVMKLKAKLSVSDKIEYWAYDLWSDAHSSRPGGNPQRLLPTHYLKNAEPKKASGGGGGAYRNSEPYYQISNLDVNAHFFEGPLRVSALRSLGAFANIFAIESFMDELSVQAGKDPLKFRMMHSTDPRAKAVLQHIEKMTRSERPAAGEGIGYAFSRYKNSASYVAVAVKLSVNQDSGGIRLQNMWAVIDSGEVINPDGLRNQTEGGMIQAASWAIMEKVQFDTDRITSTNWGTYPILRFDNIPKVEVDIIDRPDEPPLGAGEAVQGPTAAAIANAIYRATGERIRNLPIGAIAT